MKNYLDTLSLLETGDAELIRSLQSMGYADELNHPSWEPPSSIAFNSALRNQIFSGSGLQEQQK